MRVGTEAENSAIGVAEGSNLRSGFYCVSCFINVITVGLPFYVDFRMCFS